VGCSIGGLVGALIAAGMRWKELVPLAFALERSDIVRINRRAAWINGIKQESVFHDEPLKEYIDRVLPVKEWAELDIPLQVNAVNLATGSTEWFGPGADTSVSLADALYATSALPVFYPPARVAGKILVDGGTDHSFPLERAAELGATGIVAVDVGSAGGADAPRVVSKGMLAIHHRVVGIMSWMRRMERIESWHGPPLLLVRPRLDGFDTFEFDQTRYFLEEGYRATRSALMAGLTT
jgi:NTE family protein